MPNHLDFLEALDAHIRESGTDQVDHGYGMTLIARDAGLLRNEGENAGRWTGQLVSMGLVAHGPQAPGRPDPPPGVPWSDLELQAFTAYRLTAEGLATADRERRRRRELSTDVAIGIVFPALGRASAVGIDTSGAAGILRSLQSALDDELPIVAIGAAKELVEAACRWVLGEQTDRRETLPRRYKLALKEAAAPEADLGVRLTSVVDQLNAMRNETGAGHGGDSDVTLADARLAAASAVAVMEYLLDARVARSARGFEPAPS